MYTYVSIWAMPRAQWPALEKDTSTDAILQKALASGASSATEETGRSFIRRMAGPMTIGGLQLPWQAS